MPGHIYSQSAQLYDYFSTPEQRRWSELGIPADSHPAPREKLFAVRHLRVGNLCQCDPGSKGGLYEHA
jgi:hypothetical protein